MKKVLAISALLAVLLTGCSEKDGEQSSTRESHIPESRQNKTGEYDETPLPFPLYGADKRQICFGDVTSITDKNGENAAPEDLEDTGWNEIVCDGFAYLAAPAGISFSSFDNADMFDSETHSFIGVPDCSGSEYARFKPGDKFGALTVISARTVFSREGYGDKEGVYTIDRIIAEGMPISGMLKRCDASFEGAVEMTGYIRISADEYGVGEGDVLFVPDKDSMALPIMNFRVNHEDDSIDTPVWQYGVKNACFATEYPTIRLGNVNSGTDMSGFAADGTSARAKVTVTNVTMFCDLQMSTFIDCELSDIEKL